MDEKKHVTIELKAEIGDEVYFLADGPDGFRGKIPMHGAVVGYHLEADKSEGTELMSAVLYAVEPDGGRPGDPYEVPGSLLMANASSAIAAAQDENLSRWARGPEPVIPLEDGGLLTRGGYVGPEDAKKARAWIKARAEEAANVPQVPEGTVEFDGTRRTSGYLVVEGETRFEEAAPGPVAETAQAKAAAACERTAR